MEVVEGFDDHEEDAMDTGALSLSPSRTPSPVSRLGAAMETGASEKREYGETAVSPVKLSRYDEELIQAVRLCRAFVERGVAPEGRMGKLVRKLAKGMAILDGKLVQRSGEVTLEVIENSDRFMAVMREMHDGMGHRQYTTIIHHFAGRFFMPCAAKLIKNYIRSCHKCQQYARNNPITAPGYSPKAQDVFSHWSLDFAGPFPEDMGSGATYVIFGVDFLSRWVEARAVKAADAKAAADFLYEDIICKFGLPESIQSDNGSHFINAVISHLNEILKIKHKRSTPYYPQSNGRVERVVGTIKSMLKMAVSDLTVTTEGKQEKCDWVPTLSAVLWVYRGTPHSTTRMSPFFLVTGATMKMPFDSVGQAAPEDMEKWKELIALRLRTVSEIIPGIREARKDYSAPLPPADGYHIGDWVWLRDTKYDVKGLSPVFAPRWTGPYQVWQVWDKGSYRLRSHPRFSGKKSPGLLRNPVNGGRLKVYEDREMLLKALE
jgi:hypothetical protein